MVGSFSLFVQHKLYVSAISLLLFLRWGGGGKTGFYVCMYVCMYVNCVCFGKKCDSCVRIALVGYFIIVNAPDAGRIYLLGLEIDTGQAYCIYAHVSVTFLLPSTYLLISNCKVPRVNHVLQTCFRPFQVSLLFSLTRRPCFIPTTKIRRIFPPPSPGLTFLSFFLYSRHTRKFLSF